jgi:hypothetical protein
VYPFPPVGEYQTDIGASSASGQPFLKRSTRSGLLMKGRPTMLAVVDGDAHRRIDRRSRAALDAGADHNT